MNTTTHSLVQKLWNYCNVLRDDGMSYGDYVEQLTLKTSPLRRDDLNEFVALYNAANRNQRQATWSAENPGGRWRAYSFEELIARDKASLDIFWLRDDSLADSDNLPAPGVIAQEIVEDLQAALEQFKLIAADLGAEVVELS